MNPLSNIRIVLVNTTHPGNIGAVARAMKNMGLEHLWLVAPAQFPDREASDRAANARDLLNRAVVVESFDEAIAGCAMVVGSSARERRISWPLADARGGCEEAIRVASRQPVAIVFGREDRGLTNEELQKCQLHITIPANPDYSALNLSMAVQVIAYELRQAALGGSAIDAMVDWDMPLADAADIERLFQHLEQALAEMGFLKAQAPKQLMTRLRRLFQRTRLDQMEVNILRGILTSAQQWVRRARDREQGGS